MDIKRWIFIAVVASFFACRPPKPTYMPPQYDTTHGGYDNSVPDTGNARDLNHPDHGYVDTRDAYDAGDTSVGGDVPDTFDIDAGEGIPVIQCSSDEDCKHLADFGKGQCLKAVCAKAGVCALVPANDGAVCKTDNQCMTDTVCKGGLCTGTPLDCDDGNLCTTDYCDPKKGCVHDPNNHPCDDHNACTTQDFCQDGKCRGFHNQCMCSKDADCKQFDDKDKCNGSLMCKDGQCVVNPKTVVHCQSTATNVPCQTMKCNPDTGRCEQTALPDGSPCNDNSLCTRVDVCLSGKCVGTKPLDCDDGNICTRDFCDSEKGCMHDALVGTTCDDHDDCTTGDTCTEDGCKGERIPGCGCKSDDECKALFLRNGYSLCDARVSCDGGICVAQAKKHPIECQTQEHRACQRFTCDPTTGGCVWMNVPDGRPCTTDNGAPGVCAVGLCNPGCGNGTCDKNKGENCETCPSDCGCGPDKECYQGACCTPKTCQDMDWECGVGDDGCGQELDCGPCGDGMECKQHKCVQAPGCGNGTCDSGKGENCETCPSDCVCGPDKECYQGACCTPKTCQDVDWECGIGDDGCGQELDCGKCEVGQICKKHKCVEENSCGNGTCEADKGENCGTCPDDCGCNGNQVCYNDACCTPKTCNDLGRECGTVDDGCGGELDCGTCNDGAECTEDACVDGKCGHLIQSTSCYIGGQCYASDDQMPDNPCKICYPLMSQTAWWNVKDNSNTPCTTETNTEGLCRGGECMDKTLDSDNDGTPDVYDPAPHDPDVYPGAPELADGKDNNHDGNTDEGFPDNDHNGTPDILGDYDGDGTPDASDPCPYDSGTDPMKCRPLNPMLAHTDINNDGFIDIVFSVDKGQTQAQPAVWVLWGGPKGFLGSNITKLPISSDLGNGTVVGDIDGDGLADIVTDTKDNKVIIFKGTGSRQFSQVAQINVIAADALGLADVDYDGFLDMLVANVHASSGNGGGVLDDGGLFHIYTYLPDSKVFSGMPYTLSGYGATQFKLLDSNNHGVMDLLFAPKAGKYSDNPALLIYPGSKDSVDLFNMHQATEIKSPPLRDLHTDDLNGDGWPDIAGIVDSDENVDKNQIVIFYNRAGIFDAQRPEILPCNGDSWMSIADVNGDRYQDLIVTMPTEGNPIIYLGGRDGFSADRTISIPISDTGGIVVADFNQDGALDLAAVRHNDVVILYGPPDTWSGGNVHKQTIDNIPHIGGGGIGFSQVPEQVSDGVMPHQPGPYNPLPRNGADGVSREVVLRWASEGGKTFDIYLGRTKDHLLPLAQAVTTKWFKPGTLSPNTDYYWRVDVHADHKYWKGPVYKFSTMSGKPSDTTDSDFDGVPDGQDCRPYNPTLPNCHFRDCGDDGCGTGSVCGTCDDGLNCTTDDCSIDGRCTYYLDANYRGCVIDHACVSAYAYAPNNQCLMCDPAENAWMWTPVQDGTECKEPSGDDIFMCFHGDCQQFTDADGDGVPEGSSLLDICRGEATNFCNDNCPNIANRNQSDCDHNGRGDACEGCGNCHSSDQCKEYQLDTSQGKCVLQNVADGTPCTDFYHSSSCSKGACQSGQCVEQDGCEPFGSSVYTSDNPIKNFTVSDTGECIPLSADQGYCKHLCTMRVDEGDVYQQCVNTYVVPSICTYDFMPKDWPCFKFDGTNYTKGHCMDDDDKGNCQQECTSNECMTVQSTSPCTITLNDGQGCGTDTGVCVDGDCLYQTPDEWMGNLSENYKLRPLGFSARTDNIDLIAVEQDKDNQFHTAVCPVDPSWYPLNSPCQGGPNVFSDVAYKEDLGGMTDRNMIVTNKGPSWFKPYGGNASWEYVQTGPLSWQWSRILVARDLDIRDRRYWIFGVDSTNKLHAGVFYSDGGIIDMLPYQLNDSAGYQFMSAVAFGDDAVALVKKTGEEGYRLLVNNNESDGDNYFVGNFVESSEVLKNTVFPRSLAWELIGNSNTRFVCYVLPDEQDNTKYDLRCRQYNDNPRSWDTVYSGTTLDFPADNKLLSMEDAMISIQPNRVSGFKVYVASVWEAVDGSSALRYSVFNFNRDLQPVVQGAAYDHVSGVVSTQTTGEQIKIEDVYYDRMTDYFLVTGEIKGTDPLQSFYARVRSINN